MLARPTGGEVRTLPNPGAGRGWGRGAGAAGEWGRGTRGGAGRRGTNAGPSRPLRAPPRRARLAAQTPAHGGERAPSKVSLLRPWALWG